MDKRIITGENVPESGLPFNPAVQVGPWIFISGQASVDEQGEIVVDCFAGEMKRSFDNLRKVLEGAGLGLADVVQVRSYVADESHLTEYNQIYRTLFRAPYPARTTLIGCLGTVVKFEVDAVAYRPDTQNTAR